MTKKSRKKFKYLENKNNFQGEIKIIFIIFKELSVTKTYLKRENAPLSKAFLDKFLQMRNSSSK